MYTYIRRTLLSICCFAAIVLKAQDSSSLYNKIYTAPDRFFNAVEKKLSWLENKLLSAKRNYLKKIQRKERKIHKRLMRADSALANKLFMPDGRARLATGFEDLPLENINPYIGHLDSMRTALSFLDQQELIKLPAESSRIINKTLSKYNNVYALIAETESVSRKLKERQEQLKHALTNTPLLKQYRKMQSDIYYFRAQVHEYKTRWEDPSRMEENLLELVQQIPAFKDFFNKHSQLAGLFELPGSGRIDLSRAAGLQTRDMVMQQMQSRFGTGAAVQRYINANITDAQSIVDRLKTRIDQIGADNGVLDMPDFKPNNQKTKTFFQRLEFGTNLQSVRGNSIFPSATNIGLSAGYKINDRSVAGIGASYRVGWKKNFTFTQEAIGARSFVDIRLKQGFWITGGIELNYGSRFDDLSMLKDLDPWQKSALIGVSKKYRVGKKINANMQLLYDLLHARQVPKAQSVSFRVGYILN